jgi:DUF1680 family protein
MTQQTDYPWSGKVALVVDQWSGGRFDLRLRIPAWTDSAKITVNGQPTNVDATPGAYANIQRHWQAGDRVDVEFSMPVRLVEAHPLVEEARNQVAVKRGPVVYCLEEPDLPPGVALADVALSETAEYTPRFDEDVLGGMVVIETEAKVRLSADWRHELYRPLDSAPPRGEKVKLIPYFAWANRGPAEMSVWLPRSR